MFDKKQKSCIKRIHLVTDDGLYDRKAFYKVEIVFIHPLRMMTNLSIIKKKHLHQNLSCDDFHKLFLDKIGDIKISHNIIGASWQPKVGNYR